MCSEIVMKFFYIFGKKIFLIILGLDYNTNDHIDVSGSKYEETNKDKNFVERLISLILEFLF